MVLNTIHGTFIPVVRFSASDSTHQFHFVTNVKTWFLVDKTCRITRECSAFWAVCSPSPKQNWCEFLLVMRPIYGLILNEKERSQEWQLNQTIASSQRWLSCHPVDQPSVSMIVERTLMLDYPVSHSPTFLVNWLWIIGVCYRGMLVSIG